MLFGSRCEIVYEEEFRRRIKSKKVLVRPEVISEFFSFACSSPDREIAALLLGRLEGTYLLVESIRMCRRARSTSSHVEMDPGEIAEIAGSAEKGVYIVGWAHSHLGCGAFMSEIDIRTQRDFQALFSDAVALIIDPLQKGKIEFAFFRVVNGKAKKVDHAFLVRRYGAP